MNFSGLENQLFIGHNYCQVLARGKGHKLPGESEEKQKSNFLIRIGSGPKNIAMKTFYSILLVLLFIMHGNARPETYVFRPQFIIDTTDTNITLLADSTLTIAEEKKIPKKTAPLVKGTASFYSKSLEGSETATGEVFKHSNLTAASNNLPLNSWVRVTNLRNGKSVVVRINDRMHPKMAKKGRVIDLTIAAAKKIGLTTKIGLTKVSLEVIEKAEIEETDAPVIATLSK